MAYHLPRSFQKDTFLSKASDEVKGYVNAVGLERSETGAAGSVALIADDDVFFRMALKVILLEHLGFAQVIEATSLDEAFESLEKDNVTLAMFDLAMPGMKSAASLRAVRENFPDLKIAVISGSLRRDDVLLALANGVNGYVPKSHGPSVISAALEFMLAGHIYVPQSITELDAREAPQASVTPSATIDGLTPRQIEVLRLLVQGKSNKEIARLLDMGEGTVKVHVSALFRTLGTSSRSAAAVKGALLLVD